MNFIYAIKIQLEIDGFSTAGNSFMYFSYLMFDSRKYKTLKKIQYFDKFFCSKAQSQKDFLNNIHNLKGMHC